MTLDHHLLAAAGDFRRAVRRCTRGRPMTRRTRREMRGAAGDVARALVRTLPGLRLDPGVQAVTRLLWEAAEEAELGDQAAA